ncbi:MAG: AI-2E family transporter [Alphaproteobacteria bacterium]|nr:AI-2E family transporter [Alphaproteobacteria bacterium]
MKPSPRTVALFWAAILLVLLYAIHSLGSVLLPFVAGVGIAYFLAPTVDRLQRWGLSRALAALAMLAVFLLAIALIILMVAPLVEVQVSELARVAPTAMDQGRHVIQQLLQVAQERLSPADVDKLRNMVGGWSSAVLGWAATVASDVLGSGVALANLLSLVFITPLVAFYLMRDWHGFVAHLESWIPRQHVTTVRAEAAIVNETLAGFIRGQILVGIILAVWYAATLSIVGTNFAIVIGLLIGILSFIPIIGSAIGFVLAMGLTLVQTPTWAAAGSVLLIFAIGQGVEANFLSPKLVGDRVNLHPLWVIFALLAFGKLFGFLGVLLALPAAAVVGVLARFGMSRYRQSPFYDSKPGSATPRKRV